MESNDILSLVLYRKNSDVIALKKKIERSDNLIKLSYFIFVYIPLYICLSKLLMNSDPFSYEKMYILKNLNPFEVINVYLLDKMHVCDS